MSAHSIKKENSTVKNVTIVLAAVAASLVAVAGASAHANVSPAVVVAKAGQVFTLAVPTEKLGATTRVELSPPPGFAIDSFVPSPGWKRVAQATGSGDAAVVTKVTWSGGNVPQGEDATFSFLASTAAAGSYTFGVRQTYADGSVVDWNGPESSDMPSAVIEAKSSLGGGGGSSLLAVIALVVGALGVLLGGTALLAGGKRQLA